VSNAITTTKLKIYVRGDLLTDTHSVLFFWKFILHTISKKL